MKKSVMRGIMLTLCVGLVCCLLVAGLIFDARITQQNRRSLEALARAFADRYDADANAQEQARSFASAQDGLRVTVVAPDGTVLGDSAADYRTMENHAGREEITQAAAAGMGSSVRASGTVGQRLMYVAVKTDSGTFLRLALRYNGFARDMLALLPALALAGLAALAVASAVAGRTARNVAQPIAEFSDSIKRVQQGGAPLDPARYPYEELQAMAGDINRMSQEISASMNRLAEERRKIDYILDNMSEGLILLDAEQNVLLINAAACRVFGAEKARAQGRHLLHTTRNISLLDGVTAVMAAGGHTTVDLPLPAGRKGEANISEVRSGEAGQSGAGAILILSDITEQKNAAKMRQDFFEAASHELKTPITSIKGFAELLCSDMPLDAAKQEEISRRILKETTRMSSLISDIIMISRLESGDITFEREVLDLAAVVGECCADTQSAAQAAGVTLTCSASPCIVSASRREMGELAGNLIQNGVKYNRSGGRVEVTLDVPDGAPRLTVFSTGEPIAPEHRQRIFERFYRIDKGRSKAAGGTGLGLAIVKHIATGYGACVTLNVSEEGNTFTVTFPHPR